MSNGFYPDSLLSTAGSHLSRTKTEACGWLEGDRISEAVKVAKISAVTVLCVGLDALLEGEQGDASNAEAGADKPDLRLPIGQRKLIAEILKLKRPLIVVQIAGSAVTAEAANEEANALVHAFYPGALGGRAVAELLFGMFSPSGRLPVTFYKDVSDIPDFTDYRMSNRTYKYYGGTPLYPFGYGLSYCGFEYGGIAFEGGAVSVGVTNKGGMGACESVQMYVSSPEKDAPRWRLKGFKNVRLAPGETRRVRFELTDELLLVPGDDGKRYKPEGVHTVYVGGSQPDARSESLTGKKVLKINI